MVSPDVQSFSPQNFTKKDLVLRPMAALLLAGVVAIKETRQNILASPPMQPTNNLVLKNVEELHPDITEVPSKAIAGPPLPSHDIELGKFYALAAGQAFTLGFDEEFEKLKKRPGIVTDQTKGVMAAANDGDISLQPCGGEYPPCWVADRESHGDYNAINPTGCGGETCGGKWQFSPGTWNGYGGFTFAQDAPPALQDERAKEVWNDGAGCGNWSAC